MVLRFALAMRTGDFEIVCFAESNGETREDDMIALGSESMLGLSQPALRCATSICVLYDLVGPA